MNGDTKTLRKARRDFKGFSHPIGEVVTILGEVPRIGVRDCNLYEVRFADGARGLAHEEELS